LGESQPQEESGNVVSDIFGKAKSEAQDLGNKAIGAASGAVTDALDIKDFYSAHLMTFCEGDFKPDKSDPDATEEVTSCSERKPFFVFDPTAIIESKLPGGVGLADLNWPDEVSNGITAISVASRAMFFFYVVGIGAAALAMAGGALALLAYQRSVAFANLGVNAVGRLPSFLVRLLHSLIKLQLGFISLLLASAIASAVIFKGTAAINEFGSSIGLQAVRGTAFLAMTWTATVLMLLASVGWVGEFLTGRRRSYRQDKYY
jgi:SUR7/PalI family